MEIDTEQGEESSAENVGNLPSHSSGGQRKSGRRWMDGRVGPREVLMLLVEPKPGGVGKLCRGLFD